jgi:uncharacterized membrane protein HdeD (DUF308 family)
MTSAVSCGGTLSAMDAASGTLAGRQVVDAVDEEQTDLWWVFLVIGVLWLVFALLVFRLDATSVGTISVLLGGACLGAALLELAAVPASHGWARLGRLALALGFAIVGVVAFVHPGESFEALATIFAFYLLLRGVFDLVGALLVRGSGRAWWFLLLLGTAQILLAFWAAGNFGHKAFLLVVWLGATALAHGIVEIVRAFELRPG